MPWPAAAAVPRETTSCRRRPRSARFRRLAASPDFADGSGSVVRQSELDPVRAGAAGTVARAPLACGEPDLRAHLDLPSGQPHEAPQRLATFRLPTCSQPSPRTKAKSFAAGEGTRDSPDRRNQADSGRRLQRSAASIRAIDRRDERARSQDDLVQRLVAEHLGPERPLAPLRRPHGVERTSGLPSAPLGNRRGTRRDGRGRRRADRRRCAGYRRTNASSSMLRNAAIAARSSASTRTQPPGIARQSPERRQRCRNGNPGLIAHRRRRRARRSNIDARPRSALRSPSCRRGFWERSSNSCW
jgi:hypothetical protein